MTAERDLQARRRRAGLIMLFVVLSAGAKIAEIFLQPRFGWIWMVQFALSMVVFALFSGLLTDVAESVHGAYQTEEKTER